MPTVDYNRYRCAGRSHAGSELLERSAFGTDSRAADGRCRVCLVCKRAIAKRVRGSKPPRICSELGCDRRVATKGARYCANHRRRTDGRMVPRRSWAQPGNTNHDLAIRFMLGKAW